MKKINSKGITLSELIISIALISIVVMFLFNLLVDVRASDNNSDFNRKNQQQRAIILKMIQQDFLERKLVGITDSAQGNLLTVQFKYNDGTTGELEVGDSYITYRNKNSAGEEENIEKWNLGKQNNATYLNTRCVSYNTSFNNNFSGDFFSVRFSIPVVVNKNLPNTLDDLEFYYVGLKEDVDENNFPKKQSLGNYNQQNC